MYVERRSVVVCRGNQCDYMYVGASSVVVCM